MNTADIKNFKPTDEMIQAAKSVFLAMAYVQTIEPIVRNYQRKVLNRHKFQSLEGEIILDPEQSWLLNDNDFKVYLEKINIEREKVGLKVDNPEHCPLLVAQNLLRKAKQELIKEMQPITKLSLETVLHASLDHYKQLVDLSLRLLAKYVDKRTLDLKELMR